MSFLNLLTIQFVLLFSLTLCFIKASNIDYSYCKAFVPDPTDQTEHKPGEWPFLFMGESYEKKYYITTKNLNTDFYVGAFVVCERYGLKLATIKTACEYGIAERWFMEKFPTNYSGWIAGVRFGEYNHPIWMTTGEQLDLSESGISDVDLINGPYPPGGYSPINSPWVNCLTISRNCPLFTSGPTNPCLQSPTYPDLQFMWNDCQNTYRVICEQNIYS